MAWYDEAVFYHIYPLGLTGAPKQNEYGEPEHRLNTIIPWIDHIKRMNMNALYIGPLFESVGHGYETTDYKKLDSRLGTNDDLKAFVKKCHEKGIKVIFDGVFNHTGRDFFAFKDIKEKREGSQYRDWYCNVNFYGNNEYNDGFSYDNWGGYNLLVKLNQRNPAVRDYICDVIRFWVSEFDIDGIRLDAADVLDFDFMKALRRTAEEVKADFWLMGEVIHGDYSRWANNDTLHSVTDYALHKALYSGHNDHNYFEIAHTVKRTNDIVPANIRLYNFVDNHDVERIGTKLNNKAHLGLAYILEYCLPGIPSVYYGSEFGIEGKKEKYSDDSLRPHIDLKDHETDYSDNPCTRLLVRLGEIYRENRELVWGDYRQLLLTNRQFAFARGSIIVVLNNDDNEADINVEASSGSYTGLLSGKTFNSANGRLNLKLSGNYGEILVPGDVKVSDKDIMEAGAGAKEEKVKEESVKEAGAGAKVETAGVKVSDKEITEADAGVKEADAALKGSGKDITEADAGVKETDTAVKTADEVLKEVDAGVKAEFGKEEPVKEGKVAEDNVIEGNFAEDPVAGEKAAEEKIQAAEEKAQTAEVPMAGEKAAEVKVDADELLNIFIPNVPYEAMTVEQLQAVILNKMEGNGPLTDQMKKDVTDNIWHDSLVNWAKSFR